MGLLASLAVGLGLVVSTAPAASAQVRPGGVTFAVVGGVYTFNEFQGDTDFLAGIRVGRNASERLGFELSLDMILTGEGTTVLGYHANAVLYLARGARAAPFATVGLGGVTFTVTSPRRGSPRSPDSASRRLPPTDGVSGSRRETGSTRSSTT